MLYKSEIVFSNKIIPKSQSRLLFILDGDRATKPLYQFFLSPFSKYNHQPYHQSLDKSCHTHRLSVTFFFFSPSLISLCKVSLRKPCGNRRLTKIPNSLGITSSSDYRVLICPLSLYSFFHFQQPASCMMPSGKSSRLH